MTRRDFILGCGVAASTFAIGKPIRSATGGSAQYQYGDNPVCPMVEVEYIEGTGEQWIDSLVPPLSNPSNPSVYGLRIEAEVAWTHVPVNREKICGAYSPPNKMFYCNLFSSETAPSYWGIITGRGETNTAKTIVPYQVSTAIGIQTNTYSHFGLDGVTIATATLSANYSNMPSLAILAIRSASGVGHFAHARIYGFKIRSPWVADWVRDYQPVRFVNEYGMIEGGLYDRMTEELFRNQGTGAFIIGPDV